MTTAVHTATVGAGPAVVLTVRDVAATADLSPR